MCGRGSQKALLLRGALQEGIFTLDTSEPRFQLCKPVLDDIPGIASLHRGTVREQVRIPRIAPSIDRREIEVPGGRVGLWKSARDQVGKCRNKLAKRLAEAAGSHLRRN